MLGCASPHHHAEEAMTKVLVTAALLAALLPATAASADDHVIAPPDSLKWSAGPPACCQLLRVADEFKRPAAPVASERSPEPHARAALRPMIKAAAIERLVHPYDYVT
jgi:hypothetical protein